MKKFFSLRQCCVVCLLVLLAACETMEGAQREANGRNDLANMTVCCTTLRQAHHQPLPAPQSDELLLEIDRNRQVFEFDGRKAFFISFALPPFQMPYSIEISSLAQGTLRDSSLFFPRVTTYDADFSRLRHFDEKTLRMRGQQLERTVFINAKDAAERYLVVSGSDQDVQIETTYAVMNSTPVMSGPVMFNLISGADVKGLLRASPTGSIRIKVRSSTTVPLPGR